jgi:VIT1/CCC1 family predicted Fe2+/Mn2+ transporter
MARVYFHPEHHLVDRIGWLRAAVLGANDGILSTASLIVGVAAAASAKGAVLIAGVAGLVAGAMSMATGEYVSVSSQSDTERADLARERKELSDNIEFEKEELTQIYVKRGLEPSLARQVAHQLMAKDALTAHARDELGISEMTSARPVQAALTSALTFSRRRGFAFAYGGRSAHQYNCPGGVCRVFRLPRASRGNRTKAGGADVLRATGRVIFWGALAMALTTGIGKVFGTIV